MSETTKLYSKSIKTLGKSVTLTVVGDVKFSEDDNSITIPTEKVELLLSRDCGIEFSKEPVELSEEREKKEQQQVVQQNTKTLEEIDRKNREMLNALEVDELKDLLTAYPEEETVKLTSKAEIVDYLAKEMTK